MSALALALSATAACGGSGDGGAVATLSGSTTTTPDAGGDGGSAMTGANAALEDAMVEFARCMRERGIEMPDPGPGGGMIIGPGSSIDPEDADFRAAEADCKPILDEVEDEMPEPSEAEMAKMRDQMLAFARCMRAEGIDMPDPQMDEGGRASMGLPDREDPKFAEAQERCAEKTGGIGIARRAEPKAAR